jgi:hypothetical protein
MDLSIYGVGFVGLIIFISLMITNLTFFRKVIGTAKLLAITLGNFIVGSITLGTVFGMYRVGGWAQVVTSDVPIHYYPAALGAYAFTTLVGMGTIYIFSRIISNYNKVYGKPNKTREEEFSGGLVGGIIGIIVFSVIATALLPTIADQVNMAQGGDISTTDDTMLGLWPTIIVIGGLISILAAISFETNFRTFASIVEEIIKTAKSFSIGVVPVTVIYLLYLGGKTAEVLLKEIPPKYYVIGIGAFICIAILGKITKIVVGRIHQNYKLIMAEKAEVTTDA